MILMLFYKHLRMIMYVYILYTITFKFQFIYNYRFTIGDYLDISITPPNRMMQPAIRRGGLRQY